MLPPQEISDDAPLWVRLHHEQDLHQDVSTLLQRDIERGKAHVEQRFEDWKEIDHNLRLYVDLDSPARAGDKSRIEGKAEMPFRRSLMIPVSYVNVHTSMAQLYSMLTARDPYIHLEGVDTDDIDRARFVEAAIRWDNAQSLAPLVLWQLPYDQERYGFCLCYDTWEEKHGWINDPPLYPEALAEALPAELRGLAIGSRHWGVQKQWNRWQAIDPYHSIIDGEAPLWNPDLWTFVGHWGNESWLYLKERELSEDGSSGLYFNVDKARDDGWLADDVASGRETEGSYDSCPDGYYPSLRLSHLQSKIIPREWHLSPSERPEIWWFSLSNEKTIVRAHPAVYNHGKYSYSLSMCDLDMHAPFVAGTAGHLNGIQKLVNYLVFSYVTGLRKRLNDSMVYDQGLLSEKDILQPGPGRHVRLTPQGQMLLRSGMLGIPQMYHQLQQGDFGSSNLQTAHLFIEFAQQLSAATNTAQGHLFPHKRTLGEVEKAHSGGSMRVAITAQLFDHMMLASLARKAVSNRQQFTSIEQAIRISGDLARKMGVRTLVIRPEDLVGQYDYVPHGPTMSPDPARTAAVWMTMLQILAQAPQLLEPRPDGKRLDVHQIFDEAVRTQGVNYLDKFYIRVVPDEVAARAAQAGNAVPVTGPGRVPLQQLMRGAA